MEGGRPWEQKLEAVTHLLTSPTTTPSLHSQWFFAARIPCCCYLHWDYYPPILCKSLHPKWAFSIFLARLSRFGLPPTSWRSKCPYLQPPPLVLAKGIAQADWADDRRREYVRNRLSAKKRRGVEVHPLLHIVVPNLLLLSLLLLNPFPIQEDDIP